MAKTIFVEIVGNASQFKKELEGAVASTNKANSSFARMGKAAGVVGIALAGGLAIGLEKSVAAASDFQRSMELIATQAGGTQKQVDELSKGVLRLAGPTATAPKTLSEGMYHLFSQGLRGAQAMDALRIAAEGAKIGEANLEDVTNALGAVLVSGIKGAKNMSQAMGMLNATVGAGDMRMQDLADAMGTGLAAKAKIFGVTLKDISAALAVFGDNNIRGAEAGTQLASVIRLMAAPSKAGAKALAEIGLKTGDLANVMRSPEGLVGAVQLLKDKMEAAGLSATQQAQLLRDAFGGRQAGGIMILLGQLERLKTKEEEVGQGAKTFGDNWAETQKTSKFAFDEFHASMQALQISLGASLLPIVTKVTDTMAKFLTFLSSHQVAAIAVAAGVAALALALMAISVAALIAASGMSAFWIAATGGLILLIPAIAALVYEVVKHWAAIKQATENAWNAVKGAVMTAIHAIEDAWHTFAYVMETSALKVALAIVEPFSHLPFGLGHWARVAKESMQNELAQIDLHRTGTALNTQIAAIGASMAGIAGGAGARIGASISQGVAAGIGAYAAGAAAAAAAMVTNAVAAAQAAARSHSPSLETMLRVGLPLVQGVVVGIKAGTPMVQAASGNMVKKATQEATKWAQIGGQKAGKAFAAAYGAAAGGKGTNTTAVPVAMQIAETQAELVGDIPGQISALQDEAIYLSNLAANTTAGTQQYLDVINALYGVNQQIQALVAQQTQAQDQLAQAATALDQATPDNFAAAAAAYGQAQAGVAAVTEPAINLGGGGFGGGGTGETIFNFTFPNYVGSKEDLVDIVRSELLRTQSRNVNLGFT